MTKFIHTPIRELSDDSKILQLLQEIEIVIQFPLSIYRQNEKSMVIHYLKDYRRRRPIGKVGIDTAPFPKDLLLSQKIKKLHDTDIYWLCHEIAQIKQSGVEPNSGKTLYVFLDQFLKDSPKNKKKPKVLLPGYLIQ